jgi:hypothetical protein
LFKTKPKTVSNCSEKEDGEKLSLVTSKCFITFVGQLVTRHHELVQLDWSREPWGRALGLLNLN